MWRRETSLRKAESRSLFLGSPHPRRGAEKAAVPQETAVWPAQRNRAETKRSSSLGSTESQRSPAGPSPEIGPWFPSVEEDRQATRTQAHCSHPYFPIALPSRSEAAIFTFSTGEFTFIHLQISEIITAFSLNFSVLTCASIRS